ncbi:hypothetical protein P879_03682, partial [Paragonimus westermani]
MMMRKKKMSTMRTKLMKTAHHRLPTLIGCVSQLVGDREARLCVEREYCQLTVIWALPKCITFIPDTYFLVYMCSCFAFVVRNLFFTICITLC